MVIEQRLYTVEDVWELSHKPENANHHYYLIDGELYSTMPPGGTHGSLAGEISRLIGNFVRAYNLGRFTVETGFHPPNDRGTLLSPDVAFLSKSTMPGPLPAIFVPIMPDLAVEVMSPTDSLSELHRKAETYLRHGTSMVWIVKPSEKGVDVCRAGDYGGMRIESVGKDGVLSGETVLPGFEVDLGELFNLAES